MYNYEELRSDLFTEDGVKMLTKVRDKVKQCLDFAGAVSMGEAITSCTGDSWTMMACVDYLVEQEEIKEVTGSGVAGQHRIFVSTVR